MCGIAGILNLSGKELNLPRNIKLMTSAISHRGPDGEGFALFSEDAVAAGSDQTPSEIFESQHLHTPKQHLDSLTGNYTLAFGHRRLSIIDLSPAGHQPLCSGDKNLWITYNGEIYNYLEIRAELEGNGHVFVTNTDTEVILNAYLQWGERCLDKFNGMWSFVIYNRNKQELFAARDRFGVKPFYYYKDSSVFAFASEQKALIKLPFVKSGINTPAVFDFFAKGEIEYEEEGMFRNILELFPSHALSINCKTGEVKKWKYYALEPNDSREGFDKEKFKAIAAQTEELLLKAVSLRLRSDVQVGSCLSGGIDSSAIVGMMDHLLKSGGAANKLNVFTASFEDQSIDESKWAKLVAEQTGAEWHQTRPDSTELIKDIEQLIYCQDVPIWSTSTYAQYRVMQLAKQKNIKVVLDGQGADELFAGYDTYGISLWNQLLSRGSLRSLASEMKMAGKGPGFYLKQQIRFKGINALPSGLQSGFHKKYFNDTSYLDQDFWNENKNRFSRGPRPQTGSLNRMLYGEFYNTRLKGYLKCEDRCSMWHSVESRTPFADDLSLIEHAFSVPGIYKMHDGVSKFLLRESVKKFIPKAILDRKDKKGYATPNNKWISEIKEQLSPYFTDELKDFINVDKLKKEYDSFFTNNDPVDKGRVFKFISFAIWKKVFKV